MIRQMTFRASRAIAAGAIAAALVTTGLPALAASQASQKSGSDAMTVVEGWANPNMAQLAASSGRLLIDRIEAAKYMIDTGQMASARDELDGAQDTASAIRTMMPFIVVVDSIRNAKNKLIVEGVEQGRDDLLPIYSQLDEMSLYAPELAKDAKRKLDKADAQVHDGKIREATKTLDDVSDFITKSTVYLPVLYVYDQVAIARAAITGSEPKADAAKRAVDRALNSLVTVVTSLESAPKA